jgi:hypothetical protein
MESILLTLTLKSESRNDLILIEHLRKFRTGKGNQERGFEIRRLLHAGLKNQKSFSESFDAKNNPLYQDVSEKSAPTRSFFSSSSNEDVVQESDKPLAEKNTSYISKIESSATIKVTHESLNIVAEIQNVELKISEQKSQQLSALSPVFESLVLEPIEYDEYAGIRDSFLSMESSVKSLAIENKTVNTGEVI